MIYLQAPIHPHSSKKKICELHLTTLYGMRIRENRKNIQKFKMLSTHAS